MCRVLGFELAASLMQCVHAIDEVADGAAEPVQPPNHQSVAGADLVQELVEFGA